ncbi:helix-turn-helix domain-containing protein [Lentzea sp. NPDC060358]|uniref:helix-turn-helix domain-containing protein n=1 Tax=Lentzea sp. NPDC060358 TaxID=3347103 RepID=UPI00364FDFDA
MAEPTYRQQRLGEALKSLRERAGMSQHQVARRLHYNVPKISRIENGQLPDIHAMRAMLDLFGVIGEEETPYIELWELAKDKGWWRAYDIDGYGYLGLEHDASRVREFQLGYIPGQLQTVRYMTAVFEGSVTQRSRKRIETDVAIRMRRQQRLVGDNPLDYHGVISEAAVRPVDREQLLHLVETGRLPNVTIQLLPESVGPHDGQGGPFTLLDMPFAGDPQVLYIEHMAGAIHIEDPHRLKAATLLFKHLSELALSHDDSATWIERLAAER